MNRIALLGASRGLGWALYQELSNSQSESAFFLSSRKIVERQSEVRANTKLLPQDFSKVPINPEFIEELQKFKPTQLFYVAGGGPHGNFSSKKWTDHLWALNTSFLFPAQLLHLILSEPQNWPELKQLVFVGSAIAESQPDPGAASYAAAKHALKGLLSSVQAEGAPGPEIVHFSPGYMQTALLPATAWPREKGLAEDPRDVAKKLIASIEKNNQR